MKLDSFLTAPTTSISDIDPVTIPADGSYTAGLEVNPNDNDGDLTDCSCLVTRYS